MKFFQGKNPSSLWDGKNNKAFFSFSERHLETTDKPLIKMLLDMGYTPVKKNKSANKTGPSTLG